MTTWFVPTDNNGTGSGTPDALNATLNLTAKSSNGQIATTTFKDAGPGINYQQWEDLLKGSHNPQWANGQANPNQAIYLEGDTVPYWFQGTNLDTTQTYGIRVNLNYYQANTKAGGFAYLNTYNTSIQNIPNNPGGITNSPTQESTYTFTDPLTADPQPIFYVQNADVLSVTYENNVTPTSTPSGDTDRLCSNHTDGSNTATVYQWYGFRLRPVLCLSGRSDPIQHKSRFNQPNEPRCFLLLHGTFQYH
ncbi:hypothetical protein ACE1CI_12320 [Aerosakkonemataceae cyanobacterium BLCC-F50]|uniref:Uncharacterized protein n=1 Tax=Floridaenema flaviceps BLCC-F50 TaxID=3153642 RepID=A0ABV4XQX6_9CYAN